MKKLVRVGRCRHGEVLIAIRSVPSNTVLGIIRRVRFLHMKDAPHCFLRVSKDSDLYWGQSNHGWDCFADHSDTANARFELRYPSAILISTEPIRKGQEVTINYHDYGDRLYKHNRYHTGSSLHSHAVP